jgi:hypothetical protein
MRLDSSGRLGVGTTPSTLLHIQSTDPAFRFKRSDAGTDAYGELTTDTSGLVTMKCDPANAAAGSGFRITVDNSEALRVDSSGRLGLGTSSPSLQLTLNSSDTTGTGVRLENTSSGGYNWSIFSIGSAASLAPVGCLAFRDATNAATRLVIDPIGRVGIGVTSPGSLLHVEGGQIYANRNGAGTQQVLQLNNSDTTAGTQVVKLAFGSSGTTKASINAAVYGNDYLTFNTGSDTERARIDSSGRLLVGTSTALGTNNSVTIKGTASSNPSIFFGRNENASGITAGEGLGFLEFGSGDGGIGAQIEAEADGTWSSVSDCPSRLVFSTTADGASSPTERFRLNSNGQLCINTTTATTGIGHRVYIEDGTTYAPMGVNNAAGGTGSSNNIVIYRAGTQVGSITTTNTATAYNTSSDYRLKENVVPLTGAVDRINQLQVHRFNFIGNPDTTVDGFIAHEAQAVVPECVTGTKDEVDADGNPVYQGIDQSKLVPLLTAALQEALAEIESLKARVTALEP